MARVAITLLSVTAACASVGEPVGGVAPPSELSAEALGLSTVRVTWRPSESPDVAGYELQRRTDLRGEFETIESALPSDGSSRPAYFDTDVEPDRFYGYRVRAYSKLGATSAMSNVAGAKTSARPGLSIQTTTSFVTAESADPDGYVAVIRGARDTSTVTLAINGQRTVSPIARGTYSVVLRGLAVNCATANLGDTVKSATVTDEGTRTVVGLSFSISCRDPRKASIVTSLQTVGDTIDADGVVITVSGIIREAGTPADERVYLSNRTLTGATSAVRFDNLRPGDYEVSIGDIDTPCVLSGDRKTLLQPKALAVDTVRFGIVCRKPVVEVDTLTRPFVLRHVWSSATARPGDRIALLTSLDLSSQPTQEVAAVSGTIDFDNSVIRYDSSRTTGAFDVTTVSNPQPKTVALAAINTGGQGLTGNISIVRTWFTVVGAAGSQVRTSTLLSDVLTPQLTPLNSRIRIQEGSLSVSAGGGGPTNQAPTAVITGPATGLTGSTLNFSGAQSADADGTIATYAWSFGDGATGSGVSVSHVYAAAGVFVVRLTVTDNLGLSTSRESSVTVTAPTATSGSIAGTVTSPQIGAIAGATVAVVGGASATTSATGAYSIAGVASGVQAVSVSGLPTTCTPPSSQSVTVAAAATATANFTVTCTTTTLSGTISGRVTRVSDGSGIGFARVLVQPTGGAALALVTTTADGSYTVANVPVGTGTGTVTVSDLPVGCTAPGGQPYTGLAAGATVVRNISVTCVVATTGTVSGTITRSTGPALAGVQVTLTPTGGAALPPVTTSATGAYTVPNVPAGGGTVAVGSLPSGCTNPGAQAYSGLAAGGTATRNISVTCVAAAHTYPFSATWGAITSTGPTGRQVTLTLAVDMGAAPGRPDIDGANADKLASISFYVAYNGAILDYVSRTLLSPDELDAGSVNETAAGTANARANAAVFSLSGGTKGGTVQLIRLTFNIATGASGNITPTLVVNEALATTNLTNVTSSVVIVPASVLTIP